MNETVSFQMTLEQVALAFGVDPRKVGKDPVGWAIAEVQDGHVSPGDLVVITRDGKLGSLDVVSMRAPNFAGVRIDSRDPEFLCYCFKKI